MTFLAGVIVFMIVCSHAAAQLPVASTSQGHFIDRPTWAESSLQPTPESPMTLVIRDGDDPGDLDEVSKFHRF